MNANTNKTCGKQKWGETTKNTNNNKCINRGHIK